MPMTVFDLFVLAIVGASVAAGALRGFVRALIASVGLAVGFFVASHTYEQAGAFLKAFRLFESAESAHAAGFLLMVGVVLVAGFVLGQSARAGLRRARLGWFDRALGAGFGFLRGAAVCSVVYLALTAFRLFESVESAHAAGFLLMVGVVLVAGFVLGQSARAGLRRARLEWFDRALGAGFGFLRGAAVCSVVYLALTAFPVRLESVEKARTGPALAEGARLLALCTSGEVRARFLAEYHQLFA